MICSICQRDEELRPYGPGGADICFDCMKSDPQLEVEAEKNFVALLNANKTLGNGITVIGGENGPQPFTGEVPQ